MTAQKQNIYLVGMPGAGKSTVGKALARQLGLTFVDADQMLIEQVGASIATIFEFEGEAGFRQREVKVIAELCQRQAIVLATGGGAILRDENRVALRESGIVIYLHANLDQLAQRTRYDARRPLLNLAVDPRETLKTLLTVREPLYRSVADLVVETGRQSIGKMVQHVVQALGEKRLRPPEDAQSPNHDIANSLPGAFQ